MASLLPLDPAEIRAAIKALEWLAVHRGANVESILTLLHTEPTAILTSKPPPTVVPDDGTPFPPRG